MATLTGRSHFAHVVIGLCVCSQGAAAQCDWGWSPIFQLPGPGTAPSVEVFDDQTGHGPQVYVGGTYRTASGGYCGLLRWNGAAWASPGNPNFYGVDDLQPFNLGDGSATRLFAINVVKAYHWNGSLWSTVLGIAQSGESAVVFNDGLGDALYFGGADIRRWRPATGWTTIGITSGNVRSLSVFDDGTGAALYVGGEFTTINGTAVRNVAKWTGTAWTPLGIAQGTQVLAILGVNEQGLPPGLYIGGIFTVAGGVSASNVARWDGTQWSALGSGTNDIVNALAVFESGLGEGPGLYVGGEFVLAGGQTVNGMARWDGSDWQPVGTGIQPTNVSAASVQDLVASTYGDEPVLVASGGFRQAGEVACGGVATWDGLQWSAVGIGHGVDDDVFALYTMDGDPSVVFAGGDFTTAGLTPANRIAQWNGSTWTSLATGVDDTVFAISAFDDGSASGPCIYAAGDFLHAGNVAANHIAKWDGSAWSAVGDGTNGRIYALAVFDAGSGAGPELYAAGSFTQAGGVEARHIAKWNGSRWSPLGEGVTYWVDYDGTQSDVAVVRALVTFDDPVAGPALIVGGYFDTAGGEHAYSVARWDGVDWAGIGQVSGLVRTLAIHDAGEGPRLYAAGDFLTADEFPVSRIAKWSGTGWGPVGSGANQTIESLIAVEGEADAQNALYAGGRFSTIGGMSAKCIARFDGETWSQLDAGAVSHETTPTVHAMTSLSHRGQVAVLAGGQMQFAGNKRSSNIGQWLEPRERQITIVQQPQSLTVHAGHPAVLSVGATCECTLSYQWRKDGMVMSNGFNVSGATTKTLKILPTILTSAGNYEVSVWNECETATSNIATLQVLPFCYGDIAPPGGDGQVNIVDLLAVIAVWGEFNGMADMTGDGTVDVADLLAILAEWGPCT